MKSDRLDLKFLLQAKNKSEPLESEEQSEERLEDDTSVLQNSAEELEDEPLKLPPEPELLSEEKTSEFEINEDAVDLMWVLEKKEQEQEFDEKTEEQFNLEETDEPKFIESEDDEKSQLIVEEQAPTIDQEEIEPGMEWEPLILPEEPEASFEDDEIDDFALSSEEAEENSLEHDFENTIEIEEPEENVQDDLKLIIEQIQNNENIQTEEETETAAEERPTVEFGIGNEFEDDALKFELEDEAHSDSSKEEINELIEVIHPESEEDHQPAFSLETTDASVPMPDIASMLQESEEDIKPQLEEDTQSNDLNLMPSIPDSTLEKKESREALKETTPKPEPQSAPESAFAGFLKAQQNPQGKEIQPKKVQKKAKHLPRFKKGNQFSFKDLFESHSLLGLDVGADSVKYIHLKKSGRTLKFINLKLATNPYIDPEHTKEEKNQILGTHLSKNFNIKNFKNAVIRTAISGMEVVFKNVQVPHMAKKELTKAVPWACRKDFPFPLESTVFDFKNITDAEKKAVKWDMFVVAGQKDLINSHLNLLSTARILPAKISTIPEALWRAFQLGDLKDSPKCHILMDIGANSSHIVFINKGRLEFAREISTAGSDFTNSLAGVFFVDGREIEISIEEAEKIKQQYGLAEGDAEIITDEGIPLQEFSVMMGPILERLISNIQRTIEFYKEKFQVREIADLHLTGGGSLMKNLPEKFKDELNINVKLFSPFDFISLKKADNAESLKNKGPLFAVPVGLAIGKVNELNLLPPELKGSFTIEYLKRIYKYVFIIFLLVMSFLSQNVARKINDIETEFLRLNTEFRNSEPMRKKYLAMQKTHQNLLAIKSRYGNSLESDVHAVNYLKVISLTIPPKITLTSLRVFFREVKNEDDVGGGNKQTKKGQEVQSTKKEFVVLDGIAFESNSMEGMNLATFLMQLEKANYFESISLTSQKIREDGSLQFTVECKPYEVQ